MSNRHEQRAIDCVAFEILIIELFLEGTPVESRHVELCSYVFCAFVVRGSSDGFRGSESWKGGLLCFMW